MTLFSNQSVLIQINESPDFADKLVEALTSAGFDAVLAEWYSRVDFSAGDSNSAGNTEDSPDHVDDDPPRVVVTDRHIDGLGQAFPDLDAFRQAGRLGVICLGDSDADVSSVNARGQSAIHLGRHPSVHEICMAVDLMCRLVQTQVLLHDEQREVDRWARLAMLDPLTGLPNRRSWEQELIKHLASHRPLCVAVIDVDYFKRINDREGHPVGDAVLREVAQTLRAKLRQDDVVARLGGDEFGVIINQVNQPVAIQLLDRLRCAVVDSLKRLELPSATLSAGVVGFGPQSDHDTTSIYAEATLALRIAKQNERNCTVGGSSNRDKPSATTRRR